MIKSKDLNSEIKILDDKVKVGEGTLSDVVKAVTLVAKVLRDVRTNQVSIMRETGVKLIEQEPPKKTESKTE